VSVSDIVIPNLTPVPSLTCPPVDPSFIVRVRNVYTIPAGARVAGDRWIWSGLRSQRFDQLRSFIPAAAFNFREFGDPVDRSLKRILGDLGDPSRLALRTSFRIARDPVAKPFTMDDLAPRIRGMIDGEI
jgi:hypothetical protein